MIASPSETEAGESFQIKPIDTDTPIMDTPDATTATEEDEKVRQEWWTLYERLLLNVLEYKSHNPSLYTSEFLGLDDQFHIKNMLETLSQVMGKDKVKINFTDLPNQMCLSMLISQLQAVLLNQDLVSVERKQELEERMQEHVFKWIKEALSVYHPQSIHLTPSTRVGYYDRWVRVCKAALFRLLNAYLHQQHTLLPVFYVPQDDHGQQIAHVLETQWDVIKGQASLVGNPIIRYVPCLPNSEKYDKVQLESLLSEDYAQKYTPCLLLGRCGTWITGESDDLEDLRLICDKNFMWLHVEGHNLALLMSNVGAAFISKVEIAKKADSLLIDLGGLFGFGESLPCILLYLSVDWSTHKASQQIKEQQEQQQETGPVSVPVKRCRVLSTRVSDNHFLSISSPKTPNNTYSTLPKFYPFSLTLPIWLFSEIVGKKRVKVRLLQALEMAKTVSQRTLHCPHLSSMNDDHSTMCLVRYQHTPTNDAQDTEKQVISKFNFGTQLIYCTLPADIRQELNLELVEIEEILYIRYHPVRVGMSPDSQALRLVPAIRHFLKESERIYSTLQLRQYFEKSVQNYPQLSLISQEIEPIFSKDQECDFSQEVYLGLGAIRYVPTFVGGRHYIQGQDINPDILEEIQRLNDKLADSLADYYHQEHNWDRLFVKGKVYENDAKARSSARRASMECWGDHLKSSTKTPFGNSLVQWKSNDKAGVPYKNCIRIGVDVEPFTENSIDAMIALILNMASRLERDGEVMASVASIIQKGIKEAERELKLEAEKERPGLVSYIPIVGPVMEWVFSGGEESRAAKAKTFTMANGFTTKPLVSTASSDRSSMSTERESEQGENSLTSDSDTEQETASDQMVQEKQKQWAEERSDSGLVTHELVEA